jgi:hypothetical protein
MKLIRIGAVLTLLTSALPVMAPAAPVAAAVPTCQFMSASGTPSAIKHVIHLQFDNVHFSRDLPNVPSDLEQMPNLLNFIENNGALLSNDHTPLIAHTAHDLMTGITGVYGDQSGIPVSNSFEVYNNSAVGSYNTSAFTYWTDKVAPDPADPNRVLPFQMIDSAGNNLPAPWLPFVNAGCNFGAVSNINMVLENNGNDVNQVFGPSSAEAAESAADRTNDFVGIAVHCADNTCSSVGTPPKTDSKAKPELGGQGLAALYGHKYVASQVANITQLDGTPITGFAQANGFNPSPSYTLGYMVSLLQANVPVVYGYIADAHDSRVDCARTSAANPVVQDTNNGKPCGAYAPGEAGYVQQLKDYDSAFGQFFQKLDSIGIGPSNTLFVIHSDENDHYGGTAPLNPCDGVHVACQYDRTTLGEITEDLPLLLQQQQLYDFGVGTGTDLPYGIDFDTAPGFWLKGHPANGSASVRKLEGALSKVTAPSRSGQTRQLFNFLVDQPGLKALHMITSDNDRTPGVVGFGQEDHFMQTTRLIRASDSTSTCNRFPATTDGTTLATCTSNAFIWLHGDFADDINHTWAAMVGPGVRHAGEDSSTWADHADLRPTMMTLLCLKDSYAYEGRALLEDIEPSALPRSVAQQRSELIELGRLYKRINAPVGDFGKSIISLNTLAIRGNDATYNVLEGVIQAVTTQRDGVANQLQGVLGQIPGCGGLSRPADSSVRGHGESLLSQVHAGNQDQDRDRDSDR